MQQQTFEVSGMHCASCSSIISKRLKKLQGINDCNVNFTTEKATIDFDPEQLNIEKMNSEINKLGYKLSATEMGMSESEHAEHLGLSQTKEEKIKELYRLENKIKISLPISLIVFGLMIWDMLSKMLFIKALPFPMELVNGVLFIISAIFLFWIGKPYLEAVKRFIQYKVANMDTLVGIGTLTAFIYSSIIFLFPTIRNQLSLPEFTYFDVSIVVIGFITLGKYLESRSKLRTGEAIEKLLNLQAKTALVRRNGKEIEVPVSEVKIGDILIVKQGGKIPVDGIIIEGNPSVDESMINGEPLPKDKQVGDYVIGSTINKKGIFEFKAQKVGSETMLSQIVKLVENAQGSKADIQNLADKISSVFVPVVLVIAFITLIAWLIIGTNFIGFTAAFSFALLSFVGVLVIACPCALGLATPTAIIVGVGKGAESGILIKNAQSLEKLHKVDTLVFDKTGTITNGKPEVTDVIQINKKFTTEEIMEYSSSLEKNSQHPLADSIVREANSMNIKTKKVINFKETEGVGVSGDIGGYKIVIRKPGEKDLSISELNKLQKQGKTAILLEIDNSVVGIIAISDTIKMEAKDTIDKLHKLRIKTVMLTGDNKKAAEFIANQLGIDEVRAEVLPKDKSEIIKDLQEKGRIVAMAGDGINDAPGLSQANVGIAMATGTDIAIESSDITLLGGDISKIPQAIRLSKSTMNTIKQNLFWAFIYNIIGIPLASGVLFPIFGLFLNPVFAGGAMAMSSVSVVANSLLLKRTRI